MANFGRWPTVVVRKYILNTKKGFKSEFHSGDSQISLTHRNYTKFIRVPDESRSNPEIAHRHRPLSNCGTDSVGVCRRYYSNLFLPSISDWNRPKEPAASFATSLVERFLTSKKVIVEATPPWDWPSSAICLCSRVHPDGERERERTQIATITRQHRSSLSFCWALILVLCFSLSIALERRKEAWLRSELSECVAQNCHPAVAKQVDRIWLTNRFAI